MSEKHIFRFDPKDGYPKGKTDWARFDAMTDEEAYQNALDDPDAQPMSAEEMDKRRIVNTKRLRDKLGMTQEVFADTFGLNVASVRDWEQMRSMPDKASNSYLKVIEKMPEAVATVFSAGSQQ